MKQFLSGKGIPFKEVDLTVEVEEQRTVVEATGMLAVPQTNIDGEWVIGFDPGRISKLLGI